MKDEYILDLKGMRSEVEFNNRVAEVLEFPQYYGKNLDAFWDCITDIIDKTSIKIVHFESLGEELKPIVSEYLALLLRYQDASNGRFTVLGWRC